MNIRTSLILWAVLLTSPIPVTAGDMGYYRIGSTQETRIVSLSDEGILTWTSTNPSATCRILWSFWLDGPWMTNFDMTTMVSTGAVRVACVSMPERIPDHCRCVHNLQLLKRAVDRVQVERGREPGDMVTLWDLLPYLPNPPPACPKGGFYVVNYFGVNPVCSYGGGPWPHALP